jgi:hypothetical protein
MISLNAAQRHLVAGSSCGSMLRLGGEATLRAPGLVPVAKVQLLIGTFSVLFSSLMASLRTLFVACFPNQELFFRYSLHVMSPAHALGEGTAPRLGHANFVESVLPNPKVKLRA